LTNDQDIFVGEYDSHWQGLKGQSDRKGLDSERTTMGSLFSRLNVCKSSLVGCRRTPQRGVSRTTSAPGPPINWLTDTVKENEKHSAQGDMHALGFAQHADKGK
jgi:hypothetical protein